MSTYQFTHSNLKLSKEQRNFYEINGFILIKNNVNPTLLDEVRQRFIDICNKKVETGWMTVMKDHSLKHTNATGEYLINKIQDFLFDDVLWKYCIEDSVVDVIESIIGPNITAVHSMFINKPPQASPEMSLHPLHQDLYYFPFRPAHKIVASWTAVERINQANGGLFVIPGSHTQNLYKHDYGEGTKNKLYHGIHNLDHLPKLHVEMEKGDTIFFHPLLLHGSGPNKTQGFRKAISCHYAASDCKFIDVRGTVQESIAVEIEGVSQRRGVKLSFVDLWKYRSRLVRGTPGNFQTINSHF